MTKEEKELLLKDLCARLPYGVIYHRNDGANIELREVDIKNGTLNYTDNIVVRECKPYLRPMSSMTEEERKEIENIFLQDTQEIFKDPIEIRASSFYDADALDWFLKKHFDYRKLIEKGLALEAPEGMYKEE